jgi:hypothetical protein
LPAIAHDPMGLLKALGEKNWVFYRAVFGSTPPPASR